MKEKTTIGLNTIETNLTGSVLKPLEKFNLSDQKKPIPNFRPKKLKKFVYLMMIVKIFCVQQSINWGFQRGNILEF